MNSDEALMVIREALQKLLIDHDVSMTRIARSGFDFRIDVESALYKGKRIDTMWKTIKFVGALKENGKAGKFPDIRGTLCEAFPE